MIINSICVAAYTDCGKLSDFERFVVHFGGITFLEGLQFWRVGFR